MAIKKTSPFEAAVPGMGLTAEPRGRPWSNPPQYSTVEDAVSFYMPMFEREEFQVLLIEQLENQIPMTAIANIFVTASVMEGKHSIDVGILVAPVLIEAMITIAENAGVDYVVGNESERYKDEDESLELIKRALDGIDDDGEPEMQQEQQQQQEEEPVMAEEAMPQRSGLMAPRGEM